jgi:2-dehydropantoate 2-reductase
MEERFVRRRKGARRRSVLFCVKSQDTESAACATALSSAADAGVALQNGVDAARLATLPQPIYAAVVYVGTIMQGPGRVRHSGGGRLVIGTPRNAHGRGDAAADLAAVATMFAGAGVPCATTDDVEAALWTKLAINCAFNAVSALGRSLWSHTRRRRCAP